MIKLIRTDSSNKEFIELVKSLDAYLTEVDGEEHPFYDQYNKIDAIKHVVVVFDGGEAVSCGAMKEIEPGTMEIKRMFTRPQNRGKGIAGIVLMELEKWAKELNYRRCILETGVKQKSAIALYTKSNYKLISNFGPYEGIENSVCFEKTFHSLK